MKSIAGFICFVSLFFSAVSVESAYGEIRLFGKPYDFSLAAHAGVAHGTAYEIVYQNENSDEYLSELQWALKPLFVMGIDVILEPVRTWGFFTKFDIKAGFPAVSGTMEDRDWVFTPGILSNFSSHTNKTQAAVLLTLEAGFSFPLTEWFFLRPFVSFDYVFFKMEGQDGYYRYADSNYNWKTGTFSGTVIRYSQDWSLFSPGLRAGFLWNRFTIQGAIKVTPFIFCIGIDDHLVGGKTITYTDDMRGKIAVEPALDISFPVSSRFFYAGVSYSYRFITGTRGNTLEDNHGSNNFSSWSVNTGGAALRLFECSLYLRMFVGKR